MRELQTTYNVGDKEYNYDLKRLQYLYVKFINCSDQEFIENIADILHFACYVSWVKEIDAEELMGDQGLIHELVHLLKSSTRQYVELESLRNNFEKLLHI